MDHTLTTQLQGNQFLSSGLVLMLIGTLGAWLYKSGGWVFYFLIDHVVSSLEVREREAGFEWFETWFSKLSYAERNRRMLLNIRYTPDKEGPDIMFTPAPGLHIFWHNGRFFWVFKSRESQGQVVQKEREVLTIYTFRATRDVFKTLTEEARKVFDDTFFEGLGVYSHIGEGWIKIDNQLNKPAGSLILADGLLESLVADAKKFLASRKWYQDMGIPWRRGYLLYGPPGNGKSSTIMALASELKFDIYFVNLATPGLTDAKLISTTAHMPRKSILVFEEIDTAFHGRERVGQVDSPDYVTFNGLLNMLDGLIAQEGRIVVITTNHIEHLDPALIRPGRSDLQIKLNNATHGQLERQTTRFFPDQPHLVAVVKNNIPDESISMASFQEHCMRYRDDVDLFLKNLPALVPAIETTAEVVVPEAA